MDGSSEDAGAMTDGQGATLTADDPPGASGTGAVAHEAGFAARSTDARNGDGDNPSGAAISRAMLALSWILCIVLIVQLVNVAGAWFVAANTRVLDLLIRGGLVQLTDMDAGYVAGVPDAELYLKSQSPIDWLPLLVSAALIALAWSCRSSRLAVITTSAHPTVGGRARETVVALRAESRGRFLPFGVADRRLIADLEHDGIERSRAIDAVTAHRSVSLIEIAVYGVVALLLVGMGTWMAAMAWGVGIFVVCVLLTRDVGRPGSAERRASRRRLGRTVAPLVTNRGRIGFLLASLVSFPIEEMAGYLVVQALSSDVVILGGMTPTVILLALVAAKTATIVPVTPGGIGLFEWAFAAALYAQGQGLAEAVTVTLVFSAVRYLTALVLLATTNGWLNRTATTTLREFSETDGHGSPAAVRAPNSIVIPDAPTTEVYTKRLFVVAVVIAGLTLLERLRTVLVDYWLLESLGYDTVFWTNFRMAVILFVVAGVAWTTALLVPLMRFRPPDTSPRWRIAVAITVGVFAGTWWAGKYQTFLLWRHGRAFGEDDPVFGHDIGLYVFDLPAIRSVVWGVAALLLAALLTSIVLLLVRPAPTDPAPFSARWRSAVGRVADPLVLGLVGALGLCVAIGLWLRRYDVLTSDNYDSSIATGAEALDVDGLISTVNLRAVEAVAVLLLTIAVVVALARLRQPAPAWSQRGPSTRAVLAAPIAVVVVANAVVLVRDVTRVTPNEPVAQLDYLERHIDATNRAWGMDSVDRTDVAFNGADDPLPDIQSVIGDPAVQNVQLWPGAVSWLERLLDPQHVDRLFAETEERSPDLVFAATLDTFRQQQKLRPYYDFLDVDVVNYPASDGTPRLMSSAVRELPLLEPQPWLAFWGQRFVLFTHGYGVVAAPLGDVGNTGDPVYASSNVPPVAIPELTTDRHAIYYGEGSGTIGFSNVDRLAEFDYPTEQDRADVVLPDDVDAGIRMDSFVKRIAFSLGVQEFFDPRNVSDLLFSDLITDETRIHVRRQPLDRLGAIAPFLYLDSDPYAVVTDEGITWMVNGITTSDRYPYSAYGDLGDKSVRRGPFPAEVRRVNYAADSVKATVDAYTGAVRLYQISDEPVVATWAAVYPDLFLPGDEMPTSVRDHQQYPPQLFHTQFDDLWIYYHVTDPIAFFNQEDLFDDADEVLGPMLESGKGITFSVEPYPTVAETESGHEFVMSQVFTPEGARNLRAFVTVGQGGDGYGDISMQQLAKGSFVTGPEQAESIIDQTAEIAQQFGFWNSTGVEVIRGYITPLVVDDELLYVEPVFIRSQQNPFPQLARVVVVMRGHAVMDTTPENAIRRLYAELG